MNVFNIIGPIMIGPSSSHTAGAVRLGRVVNKLSGGADFQELTIELSGSFARTYRGHGTDRALLAGIMGFPIALSRRISRMRIRIPRGFIFSQGTAPRGACREPVSEAEISGWIS